MLSPKGDERRHPCRHSASSGLNPTVRTLLQHFLTKRSSTGNRTAQHCSLSLGILMRVEINQRKSVGSALSAFHLFLPLILFLPFVSKSQQFNFKTYSVEDGLAQSQVYALIQDSRGYLWMGTRGGGITRFDGINFKTFSSRDGLPNNYINCIFEDSGHDLWIGTDNGIAHYNGLRFQTFYPEKSLEPVAVQGIAEDRTGRIWFATNRGMYIYPSAKDTSKNKNREFYKFMPGDKFFGSNLYCIYRDTKNDLWVGAMENGMARVSFGSKNDDYSIELFNKKKGLPSNSIRCLAEDGYGHLWIGTFGNGFFMKQGARFFRVDKNHITDKEIIWNIFKDSHGNMWMGTLSNGICRWNKSDSSLTWFNMNDGLSNNHVRVILEDKWGGYWFGTSGGGVCKYYGQLFTHFTVNSGLSGNYIYSVFCDSRKRIWVGNSDKGLCVFDSGRVIPYSAKEHFRNVKVRCFTETPDSVVWIGTEGDGVYIYDPWKTGEERFSPLKPLRNRYVRSMITDSSGNIWIGTLGYGIYKMPRDSNGNYGSPVIFDKKQLGQDRISCMSLDKYNRVWFGLDNGGVGVIKNDSVIDFISEKDSLPSNMVRCMAVDAGGYLWVGTQGSGISRIGISQGSSGKYTIKNYSTDNGLTSSNIYLLTLDRDGNLFAGSETGVDKISFDRERNIVGVKHFGKAEGFTGIETCLNAVCRDSSGNLWFGTINGLTRYNPKTKVHNDKAPLISISQVSLFYEPLQKTKYADALGEWNRVTKTLIFPHDQNHISFDLSAINLSNPENVKLSWMLEGFDKEWSPPSDHNNATYSNLPPGDYTFLARAYNEDGVNGEPLRLHFIILKPFWAEWWFIASVVTFVLLTLITIFRWRVSAVKRRAAEQRRRLQMEKSMVELEQKALRLQMNPHFIFNALNSIQSLISKQDEQTARFYLAKFSKLMRMILENSRTTVITLEDEIKTLDNYLAIEKFCSGDTWDYKIEVAAGIDTSWITLPPMMIQPFAENAVIHGLKHLDKRGEIVISFSMDGETLVCTITDNGIGRKKAAELNLAQRESHHKSTALKVTQERLDMLQRQNHKPSLEIIDMEDAQGNSKGTKVVIRVNAGE